MRCSPQMTDEIAKLVLRNNYLQTLALSFHNGAAWRTSAFCNGLSRRWRREVCSIAPSSTWRTTWRLPSAGAACSRSRGRNFRCCSLTPSSRCTRNLLESAVPDDRYLARELSRYFPKEIAAQFPDALEHHRLRREIIATQLANSMINRGGPSLIVRIADQTGAAPAAVASAFAAVRDSYGMTALNAAIDALDNRIDGKAAA